MFALELIQLDLNIFKNNALIVRLSYFKTLTIELKFIETISFCKYLKIFSLTLQMLECLLVKKCLRFNYD